jgi:hypothetical protein
MKNFFILGVAAVCLVSANAFGGDIVTLTNSLSFEGKVIKIKKCEVVFKAHGDRYVIPGGEIQSIQFEDPQDIVYTEYREKGMADPDACMKGHTDARAFHGKQVGHFILGFLFGPFAMIGTAVSNPTPIRGKDTYALSQNKELFSDPQYLTCYKKAAKGRLIGMEAVGWGAWLMIYLIANAGE